MLGQPHEEHNSDSNGGPIAACLQGYGSSL